MSALFRLDPVQSRCGTSRAPLHEPPRRAGAKKKGRHEASLVLAPSALATLVFLRCARSEPEAPAEPLLPIGATVSIEPPLGLPRVPIAAPFPAAEPSAPRCWAKGRTSLHTGPDPVWRGFSHACLPEPLVHGPDRASGSPALWRERPGGLGRRVRARVRQLRRSLPQRLTRQPLLTKSADLEPALLVQLFDMPVNLALGSSAP